MAIATMSYVGPADGQTSTTFTHTGTTPDAIAPAFFAHYRTVYGNYFDNLLGSVTTSATDSTGSANVSATDAQIFEAYCKGIAAGTAANVTRFLQQQAAAAAIAQVQAAIVLQTK